MTGHYKQDLIRCLDKRKIDLVTAILKQLGSKGELIFYYAGHGFPDERTKTPYIIYLHFFLNSAIPEDENDSLIVHRVPL